MKNVLLIYATYFGILFVTLALWGCNPNEDNPSDEPEEKGEWPIEKNVFVAGIEDMQARLWKNGTIVNLASGIGFTASTATVIRSEAHSVFVSGSDVYVAGSEIIMNEDGSNSRARLWKNGEIQPLSKETGSEDEAFSVFVSGNDVYVLGRESLQPRPFRDRWAYKYWKNGESVIFAQGSDGWNVHSIFVSDDNVYISGSVPKATGYNITLPQAKLWKNGVEENLDDIDSETFDSQASSVFVSGNDVYVAGYIRDYPEQVYVATLWKNGKRTNLANANNVRAHSVFVSGNDVYVAGESARRPILWKNGIVQDLVDVQESSAFNSVFVSDNDVFTAGHIQVIDYDTGTLPMAYLKAMLWKNNEKLILNTAEKNKASVAVSVFVE